MKELIQFAFDFFGYVIPGLFVIFSIVTVIKLIQGNDVVLWLSALVVSILFILTHRAVTCYHWAAYDINATIKSLDLNEKTKKIKAK